MSIELKTPKSQIDTYIRDRVQEIKDEMVRRLQYIGERCIVQARSHHGYTDRTGNLTASIGYGITRDGSLVYSSGFNAVKGGAGDGEKSGADFLGEIASTVGRRGEYTLIVVAGRSYAVYVQARGYDVLGGAELVADALFKKLKAYKITK